MIDRLSSIRISRRHLQLGLGAVWLLDAALQFQPYMFSRRFGSDVIAVAAQGQPEFVAGAVREVARLIHAMPALANAAFALVQLSLGAGLLFRRTARWALVGSVVWPLGVWYFGEGMGGVLSGHASLVTGAPGAALLYVLVAMAAWVRSDDDFDRASSDHVVVGWAVVWGVGALLQALPGQGSARALAGTLSDAGQSAPGWIAAGDRVLAGWVGGGGVVALALVVAIEVVLAGGVFVGLSGARWTAVAGAAAGLTVWALGQGFGLIFSGQSTDPNSGPLFVLLAAAVYSWATDRSSRAEETRPTGRLARVGLG